MPSRSSRACCADPLDGPGQRRDRLKAQADLLLEKLQATVDLPTVRADYTWAGVFATTPDGLPYIGSLPNGHKNIQYAFTFGGNGMTFSFLAGSIIRDNILKRRNAPAEPFSSDRFCLANTEGASLRG